jgi:hypothetical protein
MAGNLITPALPTAAQQRLEADADLASLDPRCLSLVRWADDGAKSIPVFGRTRWPRTLCRAGLLCEALARTQSRQRRFECGPEGCRLEEPG